jgi:hypothetical protein
MMKIRRSGHPIHSAAVLLVSVLALGACNPALYKRPAEDFQAASAMLRDTYFLEWEISNQAQIERGDMEDQVQIWTSSPGVPTGELDRVSAKMAERRKEDIHEQLRPLREKAFNALDVYASTLVSLSSGEPTERIQSELSSFVKEINESIDAANKLNLVGSALSKAQKLTGPLQQYAGVLNGIIGVVSKVIRERAVKETIGRSNESIMDLLGILKEEAAAAEENALRQTIYAKEGINDFMSHDKFRQASNDTKAAVLKRKAEFEAIENQIANQDIASAFDAAMKAQGALVEKAMLKDPGDWTARIKLFREQAIAAKKAIEKIKSEM